MVQLNARMETDLEPPLLEKLHKYVLWSAFVVGVCLAAFGWLSTLAKLKSSLTV
jgi:hypothetical protein